MTNLATITAEAENLIKNAQDIKQLEAIKVEYLGKKGQLTELLKQLGNVAEADRPRLGKEVNLAKEKIQALIVERLQFLQAEVLNKQLREQEIDITLPGRRQSFGSLHPVSLVKQTMAEIFTKQGFILAEGPEIETEFYNFTALNMDECHPARAMQDTFYFPDQRLLRTHMSPVQIRTMKDSQPPLKIIAMGRVYRCDFDVTHTPMFHQMEGLLVDRQVSFADLKGTIIGFLSAFFGKTINVRFRPSYFPFTEPSAEVDIECTSCAGVGCRVCSNTGWLEVLGCGMVHPNVLKAGGIDSNQYQGYAFGVGLDRLTMLKYKINDLRIFFENDLRFLKQF
ncbi:MAG: phenylalanine--tRNA ligase subunit alpha [Gammaproteobacteria bacterium RIFCSPHIGHO2_12_FULL_35_23]|nr:MAG: phenylalanine--tRNA ligase subunit alpha [Gammaproteobacteria bacterium RIFCSPHIGHO2_12_FULL_35_23]